MKLVKKKPQWCRCSFQNGKEIYIGAESKTILIEKLLKTIGNNELETPYEYGSELIGGGLGLAEAHHWIYATSAQEVQKILIQDASKSPVKWIGKITIDKSHIN